MNGRDRTSLTDILGAAREIRDFVEGQDIGAFRANRLVQLSVIRQLEVIGEAARRLSSDIRRQHADIPWTRMIGMRNILIHAYDHIDLIEVWRVAVEEVPDLVRNLERILGTAGDET